MIFLLYFPSISTYSGYSRNLHTISCVIYNFISKWKTLPMTIYKVRKRNGSIITFEKEKIFTAIKLAFEAVGKEDSKAVTTLTDLVVEEVEKKV